jgi:hypothetical protein
VTSPFTKVGPKAKSGFQKAKKQLKALLGKGGTTANNQKYPQGTATTFSEESLGPSSSTRR